MFKNEFFRNFKNILVNINIIYQIQINSFGLLAPQRRTCTKELLLYFDH